MNDNFDFDKVGKRMPYTVPDGFFTDMEDKLWEQLKEQPAAKPAKRRSAMRIVMAAMAMAAAIVGVVFMLNRSQQVEYSDVEQAFAELSTDDQTYMLSVYQDDVFINEQTKQDDYEIY